MRTNTLTPPWILLATCPAVSLLMTAGGCDEAPKPPAAVVEAAREPDRPPAPADAEPARPTTQQLTDGPRHTVSLQTIPFTVRVPLTWEVKTDAGRVVLTGPAPRADVTVLLSTQPKTNAERIALLESGAKKDAAADPKRYRAASLKTVNGTQVFERQIVGSTLPNETSPTLRWTVTAFVPRRNNEFTPYELNVIGLTVADAQADEAFLRGIVDSLAYDESKDAGGI